MKLAQPKEKLAASSIGWVEDFSAGTVKAIGTLEILAAVAAAAPVARRSSGSEAAPPRVRPAGHGPLPNDSHPNVHIDPRRKQMSAAQETSNKATVRRLQDAMNTGDAELISQTIDEVFEPDVKQHTPFEATGAQTLKEMVFARLYRAFPDLHITVEDLIEEGDKVVERDTVTGTHQGEYNGLPPTGKSVAYNEIFIMRFVNGRIAEIWGVVDVFSQMKQLGMIQA
jgi:steroid delta-isomerase-like uncharacterized protein